MRIFKRFRLLLLAFAFVLPVLISAPASASGTLLWWYKFDSADISGSTVAQQASGTYSSVNMTLFAAQSGDWSLANSNQGVQFTGNTTADQSVGFAKPSSGSALNVPNANTTGIGAQFTYQTAGQFTGCNDTPNVVEIGRSSTTGGGQLKLQLSTCNPGVNVFPECRIAGSDSTPSNDTPLDSTYALKDGHQYDVWCFKSQGAGDGSAQVTIDLIDQTEYPGLTVSVTAVRPVGDVTVPNSEYISAANKYHLPTLATNTDQFNGILYTEDVCSGSTASDASSCLTGAFRTIS